MTQNDTHPQAVLDEMEAHSPESMHPILEAAFKYKKQLVIAVAIIIGVTAIYAGYSAYTAKTEASAQAELGIILIQSKGEDKIDKLESLLNTVPSSVKPAIQLEIAQACMTIGDYEKAAQFWGKLETNTDNDMQIVARLGKAKSLLFNGKAAEAVKELKDLAGLAPASFTVPVYRQLAMAAEAAGDTDEALKAYQTLNKEQIRDKPFIEYKISQLEKK